MSSTVIYYGISRYLKSYPVKSDYATEKDSFCTVCIENKIIYNGKLLLVSTTTKMQLYFRLDRLLTLCQSCMIKHSLWVRHNQNFVFTDYQKCGLKRPWTLTNTMKIILRLLQVVLSSESFHNKTRSFRLLTLLKYQVFDICNEAHIFGECP